MVAFPDRREFLFGRGPDLEELLQRSKTKGLTAVIGRPRLGKSWLLEEVGRRLTEAGVLVGYHESKGQSSDHLLRSVVDLYSRWLESASNWRQALSLWERHKRQLISGAGLAVGRLFKLVGKVGGPLAEPLSGAVLMAFESLAKANSDLRTAGLPLPPLEYDQAQELVSIISKLGSGPIVLILDSWEQSSPEALKVQARMLAAFLSHLGEWPECHIFLGLRPDDPATLLVEDLENSSTAASTYKLPEMHLDTTVQREELLSHIRSLVPVAEVVNDEALLGYVQGFPGVLERWFGEIRRSEMTSEAVLKQVAIDAQFYRYRELDEQFRSLGADERKLALRLALYPSMDAAAWHMHASLLLDGLNQSALDELEGQNVVQDQGAPGYGPETRRSAALRWFLKKLPGMAAREAERLLLALAGRTDDFVFDELTAEGVQSGTALADVRVASSELQLSPAARALAEADEILWSANAVGEPPSGSILLEHWPNVLKQQVRAGWIVREALWNLVVFLGPPEIQEKARLERLEQVLVELRRLREVMDDSRTRRRLAMALFNAVQWANRTGDADRRNSCLAELRALHLERPDEAPLRWEYAMALRATMGAEEDTGKSFDEMLAPAQELAAVLNDISTEDVPSDVPEVVAASLHYVLRYGLNVGDPSVDLENTFRKLEELHQRYPRSNGVAYALASGMVDLVRKAEEPPQSVESNDQARDWVEGLRDLQASFPDNIEIARALATAVGSLIRLGATGWNASLQELRDLAALSGGDPVIAASLAAGLANSVSEAWKDGSEVAEELLEELRKLQRLFPGQDLALCLASGLNSLLNRYADAEGGRRRAEELLDDLRRLYKAHPEFRELTGPPFERIFS